MNFGYLGVLLKRFWPVLCQEGWSAFWHKAQKILTRRFKTEYEIWMDQHHLLKSDIDRIRGQICTFEYKPKISIVMPVYNVEKKWLKKAIHSVFDQIYENWELCLVDDASPQRYVRRFLGRYQGRKKMRIKCLSQNRGIAAASNEALASAEGEFVGFLDDDDELSRDALFEVVRLLNRSPRADLIYSDEDKIDQQGKRFQPFFKPDYSPDLLLSFNYICHFLVCRKELVDEVEGFTEGLEGSQDYDLILRLAEKTDAIYHIPKILYHWRQVQGSTALDHRGKADHIENSIRVLHRALKRRNIEGTVEKGIHFDRFESYRVKRKLENQPLVSVIIPTRDKVAYLKTCIQSIREKTDYQKYELIVVDNRSESRQARAFLSDIKRKGAARVLTYEDEYNFSKMNNFAVTQVSGSCLLFLNNDTEVISREWMSAMLEHAQRQEVGAVGAKLIYPDDTIQHAGTIVGLGGVAAHSHKRFPENDDGYFGSLNVIRNYSAVTAACMMLRKRVFEDVGGFDEVHLPIGFNDVDLCLEMRKRGYLIIYTPYAALYHHESRSRSNQLNPDEVLFMKRKWGDTLLSDPYYNPNLSYDHEDFRMKID